MTPDLQQIAHMIDHTLLRPEATREDILRVCREAVEHEFASVCVNPYWTSLVAGQLAGSGVKTCCVIGFPLGATFTAIKVAEAQAALQNGAQELDMVLNIGALRGGDFECVKQDTDAVVDVAHPAGAIVKVILETALLDDSQKRTACLLAKEARADFVKTSTGFGQSGATVADIQLMRETVGPEMGVKASGGIRSLDDVIQMVAAGATRIGASASVSIVNAIRASDAAGY